MKNSFPYISATLLVAYAVYSAFVPITIAHSIILFSLAGLFAYNQFLIYSQENTKNKETLAKSVNEFRAELEKHKEQNEIKISKLEDEVTKMSLTSIRTASSSSKPETKKTYSF